jgi:hypothetical protein
MYYVSDVGRLKTSVDVDADDLVSALLKAAAY